MVLDLSLVLPWGVFKDGTTRSNIWQGICIFLAEVGREASENYSKVIRMEHKISCKIKQF